MLTDKQREQFHRDGYLTGLRVLSEQEASDLRAKLETAEAADDGVMRAALRTKPHLLYTWLADLVGHPGIVDAVEDLYGPDLLCWASDFFIKEPGDDRFVSWHQDATYWGLSSVDVVTAWLALTPTNEANGAMGVVPGSHRHQLGHHNTYGQHNMLSRGQEVAVDVGARDTVRLDLRPGEMSLHHVLLIHGSEANRSADRRIGYAIRYLPTSVRQLAGDDSATIVRGDDRYGHFELEPPPATDLAPSALEAHHQVTQRKAALGLGGAPRDGDN